MTVPDRLIIFAAVLAAGQSQRFGTEDKLAQPLNGTMLGHHICDAIAPLGCAFHHVVCSSVDHPCALGWQERNFDVAVNSKAKDGMGTSVALAAKLATETKADVLLISLADMPFVTTAHLQSLIAAFDNSASNDLVASHNGNAACPPAIFGCAHFSKLMELGGETGARELLNRAAMVPSSSEILADIDTVEQLRNARSHL